jgi:glycosyltransferase involved in cell wall biosynthesis
MGISAMNLPQISVITISYNAVEFIEQTMQSVLTQSYPFIEYIIIDGGSTDGTKEIIQHYASSLAYWHSRPDRGIAHALNLGLAQAQGDWILYLNADDILLDPSVIEKMASHLLYHKEADVVFGNILSLTREKNPQPVPFCKIGGHPWRWREFRKRNMIPHQAAFTRRHYFERVGRFDETFRTAMDYELFLRAQAGLRAQFVPITLVGMRAGGRGVHNTIDTLKEFRRAQLMNRALPRGISEANFILQLGRVYLGKLAHGVLDPFAGAIRWPGRN